MAYVASPSWTDYADYPRPVREEPDDVGFRPWLMVEAIEQLQDAGVEPDIWNIEGLAQREDCEKIVAAAGRNGRTKVGCIVVVAVAVSRGRPTCR
jgi:hypothetical protein